MPLIDQRILIAAPAEAIWTFLVSPPLMVKWHKGCKQVSILSTRVSGVGSRRRITDNRGETTVEEITHWLDNLGYEYSMIDGPYRMYKGRFRLQPIPEGTIVNWVVEYQLRGPLAGVLSARRRTEGLMAESLRQLRKLVEKTGVRIDPERQARFAMRSAPSVEDRAMARVVEAPGAQGERPTSGAVPPIVLDDDSAQVAPAAPEMPAPAEAPPTVSVARPAPEPDAGAAAADEAAPESSVYDLESAPHEEPSFVAEITPAGSGAEAAELPADDPSLADTKPRPPAGLREAIAAQMVAPRPVEPQPAPDSEPLSPEEGESSGRPPIQLWQPDALTVPVSLVAPPVPPRDEMPTQTMDFAPPSVPDTLPESVPTPRSILLPKHLQTLSAPKTPSTTGEPAPELPPPTTTGDTGEISIWDAFGVVPPSERAKNDLEAIIASLQTPAGGENQEGANSAQRMARLVRRHSRVDRPPVRPVTPQVKRGRRRLSADSPKPRGRH